MSPRSLDEITSAVRAAWSRATCDPVDQARWTPDNPAWGHCAVTALAVAERAGGELLLAEVHAADGSREGVHYSNRLPDGRRIDLTREQFRDGQTIGEPERVARPADPTQGRLAGEYALFALRVARALSGGAAAADPGRPVSAKAVCHDADGRVLAGRNPRGEWELPGGRPELGEPLRDAVVRELRPPSSLRCTAGSPDARPGPRP